MPEATATEDDPFRLEPRLIDGVENRVFTGAPDSMRDLLAATARFGDRLAAYKMPTTIVVRLGPLPRTATGKVLERQLRDELSAGGAASA